MTPLKHNVRHVLYESDRSSTLKVYDHWSRPTAVIKENLGFSTPYRGVAQIESALNAALEEQL